MGRPASFAQYCLLALILHALVNVQVSHCFASSQTGFRSRSSPSPGLLFSRPSPPPLSICSVTLKVGCCLFDSCDHVLTLPTGDVVKDSNRKRPAMIKQAGTNVHSCSVARVHPLTHSTRFASRFAPNMTQHSLYADTLRMCKSSTQHPTHYEISQRPLWHSSIGSGSRHKSTLTVSHIHADGCLDTANDTVNTWLECSGVYHDCWANSCEYLDMPGLLMSGTIGTQIGLLTDMVFL